MTRSLFLISAFLQGISAQLCDTEIPSLGIQCPQQQDSIAYTYADPDHCSRYYECFNGCANGPMQCQLDYLYDDVHGWCDEPERVDCGQRNCDGRPCIVKPPTVHPWVYVCPSEYGFFPNKDNCMKYWKCEANVATEMTCPKAPNGQQELYSPEHEWCDFPENVVCGDRPICDAQDQNCVTVSTPKPTYCDLTFECTQDGFFDEGPCEKCVCECSQGNVFEICCQPDLFWNPVLQTCDFAWDNPGCS